MTAKLKLTIPKEVLEAPIEKRVRVAEELVKALGFRATLTKQQEEQHIWKPDPNPMIASLEQFYYEGLAVPLWDAMVEVFDLLGLDFPEVKELGPELQKSLRDADGKFRPEPVRYAYTTTEKDPIYLPTNRIETPYQSDKSIDRGKVKALIGEIEAGKPLPPIVIGYDYDLHDGHHRLLASQELGISHVPCEVGGLDEQKNARAEAYYRSLFKSSYKRTKKPRLRYRPDGKPYTTKQMADLERVLRRYQVDPVKYAEGMALRATIIGKLLAERESMNRDLTHLLIDTLPVTMKQASVPFVLRLKDSSETIPMLPLQPHENQAIDWATQFAGEHIRTKQQDLISGVKLLVAQARRERWEPRKLEQELFDRFGQYNRDWRRIALTELAEATNNGYLSTLQEGETIVGHSAVDQCDACLKLVHNRVYTFRKKPGDEDKELWVGKSNAGRKKADWKPAVIIHPHCRCRWQKINTKFFKVQDGKVVQKTVEEMRGEAQ